MGSSEPGSRFRRHTTFTIEEPMLTNNLPSLRSLSVPREVFIELRVKVRR